MLDFLMLGEIPGTNYRLSFEQVLIAGLALVLLFIRITRPGAFKQLVHDIQLFYLKTRYLYFRSRII